jgi:hypothetical protein
MGFRFRKSIKIIPGIRLNISKSGISTSIGGRGATLNVNGEGKSRVTVGLPGTGLSYSAQEKAARGGAPRHSNTGFWLVLLVAAIALSVWLH